LNEPDLTDLEQLTADAIPQDAPFRLDRQNYTPTPSGTTLTPSQEIEKEHSVQEHQNTKWRAILFYSTMSVVLLCVIASVAGAGVYLWMMGREASAAVMSAWLGANVVQVVGVLMVITRHLFPGQGAGQNS